MLQIKILNRSALFNTAYHILLKIIPNQMNTFSSVLPDCIIPSEFHKSHIKNNPVADLKQC